MMKINGDCVLIFRRKLLKDGLVPDVRDGSDINVWGEKWIIDTIPRTPMYMQDSVVDLTLKASDFLFLCSECCRSHVEGL